jgi:bifunctional non-homologous end joining protein LigD
MQFQPAIPTRGTKVPANPDWIHEVKYDGFRLIVHRDGDRVRLLTRNGHDGRYPWIVESALKNRTKQFVIDARRSCWASTACPTSTLSIPAGTTRRSSSTPSTSWRLMAMTCDLLPLSMRKTNLARLLAHRPDGIFAAPYEAGEIGPDLLAGQQAARSHLSRRSFAALDKGGEPGLPRDEARGRGRLVA